MSNTISAVAVKGNRGGDPGRMASRNAARMMEELDTNQDGQVDKREFVAVMTAKGMSEQEAVKQFDAIDTQKKASIGKADIESAIRERRIKPPPAGRASGAERPAAPPPRPATATPITRQPGDPADTNQDGTVDVQETYVYQLTHEAKAAEVTVESTDSAKLGSNVDETV